MNILNTKKINFNNRPLTRVIHSAVLLLSILTSSIAFATMGQTEVDKLINDLGYSSATPIKKIYNYRVNGFNAINDDSIVLNAGPKQKYLVTFTSHCNEIRFSQKIGFTTTLSQLTKFDNIIVSNRGTGKEVCPIQDIYKLEV